MFIENFIEEMVNPKALFDILPVHQLILCLLQVKYHIVLQWFKIYSTLGSEIGKQNNHKQFWSTILIMLHKTKRILILITKYWALAITHAQVCKIARWIECIVVKFFPIFFKFKSSNFRYISPYAFENVFEDWQSDGVFWTFLKFEQFNKLF